MPFVGSGPRTRSCYFLRSHGSGGPVVMVHGFRSAAEPGNAKNVPCLGRVQGRDLRPPALVVEPAFGRLRLRRLAADLRALVTALRLRRF